VPFRGGFHGPDTRQPNQGIRLTPLATDHQPVTVFGLRLMILLLALSISGACVVIERRDDVGTPAPGTPEPAAPGTPEPATPEAPAEAPTPQPELAEASDPFELVATIVARVEPSVVAVITDAGQGSGIIYQQDGIIVTNHHVIAEAEQVGVALATGERLIAEVIGSDARTDVAVLRIDRQDLPAAGWNTELPRMGTLAVAIGSPLGFHNSVTVGVVSGLQRSIPGAAAQTQALVDLIQTDAAISPGNSGGALVGADGQVVGMAIAHIPPQLRAVSIGFAIPSATVVDVAEQIIAGEPVQHAFLGVQTAPITPELADRFELEVTLGALVVDVVPGGPAADAGIQTGDVLVQLAGQEINAVEDMLGTLRRLSPGDTIDAVVVRDGEQLTLSVELADRP
jgi:serine protease DegQ